MPKSRERIRAKESRSFFRRQACARNLSVGACKLRESRALAQKKIHASEDARSTMVTSPETSAHLRNALANVGKFKWDQRAGKWGAVECA